MKIIAQSDWLRLIFGGAVSGGVVYALVHGYPQMTWIAVPVAVLVGAISCFACEHMTEAVVKAVIAGLMVFLALQIAPKIMSNDPQWWKIGLVSLPIGFLGGAAAGSLLGGVCRLLWEPHAHYNDDDHAEN